MSLHVFHNGNDWVVAESPEDAAKLYEHEVLGEETEPGEWRQLPDDQPLTQHNEEGPKETRPCAEWAADGRAYLGSRDL